MMAKYPIVLILFFVAPNYIYAYRPFITEDAGVAGEGVAQLELSYDYITWSGDENEGQILCVPIYGAWERGEFSLEVPYLFHNFSDTGYVRGSGDINLVGKLLVMNENRWIPTGVIKGVVKTDSGNMNSGLGSGYFDYTIAGVLTKSFENLMLHLTFGWTLIGHGKDDELRNIYLYGAGVDYSLIEKLHLVAEITGNRHPDRSVSEEQVQSALGMIYVLNKSLSFDTAFRAGLSRVSPLWSTTLGLTLSYGVE